MQRHILPLKKIVIQICICYNANRQRNVVTFHAGKEEDPDRNGVQSGASSFIVAKHPLGYSLSLLRLSSHLLTFCTTKEYFVLNDKHRIPK